MTSLWADGKRRAIGRPAPLEETGIWSTGVKEVPKFGAKYVAFKDPDGIKLELWLH